MKTFLVAVDHSDLAHNVVALAAEHALALHADIVVLCCIDASYASASSSVLDISAGEEPGDFGMALDEQNTAEAVVRGALAALQHAGVNARGRIIAGESAETIVAQADALNASLIIMGRRNLSSFNRLLKGSCSSSVIERAHCPVLVDVRIG